MGRGEDVGNELSRKNDLKVEDGLVRDRKERRIAETVEIG